ncbi:hypothetical protein E4K65_11050 [Bradyrhizobium niftali]|uniref:Uncharacterized protein n=2 Tax=Bradyrhizobium niftali TaxID=2560055 RepID=A0A4Y9M0K8_9BRAD|nr:hypothetical protein E4K65_11050 [Bradyrhizobium niftali]
MGGVAGALAADGPGELRTGLAMIRGAAEILDDLAAGLAVEQVTRRGCLGHFLQAVRAMRSHGFDPERRFSVSALRGKRMVELRIVEPGIVDHRAVGALEAAEEIIEARMRATRNPAPALGLTFYERDLHGRQPRRRR